MRIKYKILWIEDTKEWLDPNLEDVKDYLDDLGFILECDIIPKYEKRNFSLYDVIVVDYNLSNDEKGSEAILKIRKSGGIYTDILFYSISGESKLRAEIAKHQVDGVYCGDRDNCVEKLKNLINTTIRKTQEINNLRGLVMAETSELDNLIRDILLKSKWSDIAKKTSHEALVKRNSVFAAKLKKAFPIRDMNLFIHEYFHSSFCFEFLSKFISKPAWLEVKDYTADIIIKRNFLAHGIEISSSATEITIVRTKPNGSTESLKFTPADFIKLRKQIRNYREKFERISSGIS